ncbi:hypothetical protein [Escherichia phage vB_EcoS_SCS92]|uniref:hypothetical protein n=1 Tax=Escherichia phage NTEC3 TaxID=2885687 RepID=UPI001C342E24|nr:hypothetical protein QCF73_gp27 [Escherichia phage NTEC3]QVR48617.1 hypothetical protein [Escherichia phage 590B]UDG73266.1 hypothetical protein [Escherichia phage NTEC3]UTQ72456.1 hypothetical protein [Escherichia phage vB_EcoS_SCS92]
MVIRYDLTEDCASGVVDITPVPDSHEGRYVSYEDYAKLEAELNDILDMLVKLDNDLGYGVIPDEYAYDRVGEILEKYRNEPCN